MDSNHVDKVAGVVNHSNLRRHPAFIFPEYFLLKVFADLPIYEFFLYTVVKNHFRGPHLQRAQSPSSLVAINSSFFAILAIDLGERKWDRDSVVVLGGIPSISGEGITYNRVLKNPKACGLGNLTSITLVIQTRKKHNSEGMVCL